MIKFSKETGCYNESITITIYKDINLPIGARLYYTLDGNDPTTESIPYTRPIKLSIDDTQTKIYPLKVVAFLNNEYSRIYQETYLLDKDVENRFDLPVISITSDYINLYDYDTGIMVDGAIYDWYSKIKDSNIPGNYSMRSDEWIRNAKITMINKNNEITIDNQDIGIAISGGTSADMDVKSLKIIANYVNDNKFNYVLTEDNIQPSEYSTINEYNSFKLHSGSQEQKQGNIRASVVSELAKQSNFDGYSNSMRVVVYLNGEFYGVFTMQENYSNSNIAKKFGIENSGLIYKYKGGEDTVLKKMGVEELFDHDLTIEENRNELEKYVDMDNYLLYNAIEILANNTDWPSNNYEAWQYIGELEDNNKYTDGRIRFLIYDVDISFYTSNNNHFFAGIDGDTFYAVMENEYRGYNSRFNKVMKSDYYKNKFITIICDLLNTSFEKDNVISTIENEYEKIRKENNIQFSTEENEEIEFYINEMKIATESRDEIIREDLNTYFGVDERYNFNISSTDGLNTYWSNINLYNNETYSNMYYYGIDFTIKQNSSPGYKFSHWIVNGKEIYSEELIVSDDLVNDGLIQISAVTEKDDTVGLIINEISAKNDSDWMKFYNAGDKDIDLNRYYISDNDKNLEKYQLPSITLNPKQSIMINGSKNFYAIGDYISNFNLNDKETLYLYDKEKEEIIDKMKVPRMDKNETYGRYLNSNTYVFYDNRNNQRLDY